MNVQHRRIKKTPAKFSALRFSISTRRERRQGSSESERSHLILVQDAGAVVFQRQIAEMLKSPRAQEREVATVDSIMASNRAHGCIRKK
jgi:hypothetical protein